MMNAIVIYLSLVFVMSVVCFTAYGLDKRRAANGSRYTYWRCWAAGRVRCWDSGSSAEKFAECSPSGRRNS